MNSPRLLEPVDNENLSRTGRWSRLARLAGYNLQKLAKLAGVGRRQLERQMEKDLGRSPGVWLEHHRLVAASWLLREKSVKEVSSELQFKQVSHFCRRFKNAYGLTPTEYKRQFKKY